MSRTLKHARTVGHFKLSRMFALVAGIAATCIGLGFMGFGAATSWMAGVGFLPLAAGAIVVLLGVLLIYSVLTRK